jgi:phosphate acyltransferase
MNVDNIKGLRCFQRRADMSIVLDAMGGDHAPLEVVKGALKAAQEGIEIVLAGPKEQMSALCKGAKNIELLDAPDLVSMGDSPSEVLRKKPRSPIMLGVQKAKEMGVPFVSAGNTGACMAAALMIFGRIGRIKRPPIASVFPSINGGHTLVLDVGANVDCNSHNLLNFAVMGLAYVRAVLGVDQPTVGLLSNGEEKEKGNALTVETHQLFLDSGIPFHGNVEGFDALSGVCDVLVTDGFAGNVLLKTAEGVTKSLLSIIQATAPKNSEDWSEDLRCVTKALSVYNPSNPEHSGAPLLGINGTCYIVHGSADANTVYGACLMSEKLGKSGLVDKIIEGLQGIEE